MDRRRFLRRAALIAAGAVAADQIELLERLTWRRRFFPGWSPASSWPALRIYDYHGTLLAELSQPGPWTRVLRAGTIARAEYGKTPIDLRLDNQHVLPRQIITLTSFRLD